MSETKFGRWLEIPASLPAEVRQYLMTVFENIFPRLDSIDLAGDGLVIPDLFIETAMIALEAIDSTLLADDAVATRSIQNSAVTLVKLLNGLFTADASGRAKFASGFVDASLLATDAVETGKVKDLNITTAKLADDAVTKVKLAGGFSKKAFLAGSTAGNFTVTGIASGDELVLVLRLGGTFADLTSEFTISATDTINNAGGTNTTGDSLLVLYNDLT